MAEDVDEEMLAHLDLLMNLDVLEEEENWELLQNQEFEELEKQDDEEDDDESS